MSKKKRNTHRPSLGVEAALNYRPAPVPVEDPRKNKMLRVIVERLMTLLKTLEDWQGLRPRVPVVHPPMVMGTLSDDHPLKPLERAIEDLYQLSQGLVPKEVPEPYDAAALQEAVDELHPDFKLLAQRHLGGLRPAREDLPPLLQAEMDHTGGLNPVRNNRRSVMGEQSYGAQLAQDGAERLAILERLTSELKPQEFNPPGCEWPDWKKPTPEEHSRALRDYHKARIGQEEDLPYDTTAREQARVDNWLRAQERDLVQRNFRQPTLGKRTDIEGNPLPALAPRPADGPPVHYCARCHQPHDGEGHVCRTFRDKDVGAAEQVMIPLEEIPKDKTPQQMGAIVEAIQQHALVSEHPPTHPEACPRCKGIGESIGFGKCKLCWGTGLRTIPRNTHGQLMTALYQQNLSAPPLAAQLEPGFLNVVPPRFVDAAPAASPDEEPNADA